MNQQGEEVISQITFLHQLIYQQDPSNVSAAFAQYLALEENRACFERIMKSRLTQQDFIMILKLITNLSARPYEVQFHSVMNNVFCDEFFDSLVNFIWKLRKKTWGQEGVHALINFYGAIVHHLPTHDIIYTKMSALLYMTYDCMQGYQRALSCLCYTSEISNVEELIALIDEKQYLLKRNYFQYTDIDIYPNQVDTYENRILLPNIIRGPYTNTEQYLDIHFKLLREDFICSVREGLTQIRSGIFATQCSPNLFLYRKIKSRKAFLSWNPRARISHFLEFSKEDKEILMKENWETTKKFMNGSLLFFSQNGFVTFFVATVEENLFVTTEGEIMAIRVCVIGNPYKLKVGYYYDMVEPRVFFEPYYQTLKSLQTMNPHNFPMAETIISLENEVISKQSSSGALSERFVYRGTDLNKSQIKALNASLTENFTLIQGPPGTGKSHLTRKLIQLLANDKCDQRPILVICMRNRALDIILEPLAMLGLKIVRFGRTESDILEKYTLFEWKRNFNNNSKPNARFIREKIASFRKIINDNTKENNPAAIKNVYALHNRACDAYRLLCDYCDAYNLLCKNIQVIGATVTGAAKRNKMISEMKPKTS